jgi:diguanylate cyclase (GGDEF)-like protein
MVQETREVFELLLKRRLERYCDSLDALDEEVPSAGGFLAAKVGQLGQAPAVLRHHAQRALRDLINAIEIFCDNNDSLNDTWELYEGFLKDASEQMLARVAQCGPAHRRRASEHVAKLASEGGKEFERAALRLKQQFQRNEGDLPDVSELDDRLPLGRRAAFDRDLAASVREAKRTNSPCALIMADIDHFKSINDQHGHPIGDEVLLEVAQALVDRVGHRGKAYRYGGEEFAVLLPGYSAEEAYGLAERLRKDIERTPVSSKALKITASFGTLSVPEEASTAKQLLKGADEALYKAKRDGRNRVMTSPAVG